MPTIHPTALLEGDVRLADDVVIGPHCVLTGPITLGAGTRLVGNVYLTGPLTMGRDNTVYPFTCLGFAPQHLETDPDRPGPGLAVGDGNTFREHVTVHRAHTDDGLTRIGDRNYFMATSHAGHDARIGSDCVFVNDAALGGHVVVQDRVTIGGGAVVHQRARVGRGAMISGITGMTLDLPPFSILTSINIVGGVNLVGLRRAGCSHEEIDDVRWAHRTVYRRGLTVRNALEALRERADRPLVAEYIAFIEASERGICSSHARVRRVAGRVPDADRTPDRTPASSSS